MRIKQFHQSFTFLAVVFITATPAIAELGTLTHGDSEVAVELDARLGQPIFQESESTFDLPQAPPIARVWAESNDVQ